MNGRIMAEAKTTKVQRGQSCQLEVRFDGMQPCPVRFELADFDSGTITPDGVYTAPNRTGSFEIRIACVGNPDINTYAYIEVV